MNSVFDRMLCWVKKEKKKEKEKEKNNIIGSLAKPQGSNLGTVPVHLSHFSFKVFQYHEQCFWQTVMLMMLDGLIFYIYIYIFICVCFSESLFAVSWFYWTGVWGISDSPHQPSAELPDSFPSLNHHVSVFGILRHQLVCIPTLQSELNFNSNSKTLTLKDSGVRSIWTYLTDSPCYWAIGR